MDRSASRTAEGEVPDECPSCKANEQASKKID